MSHNMEFLAYREKYGAVTPQQIIRSACRTGVKWITTVLEPQIDHPEQNNATEALAS